MRSFGGPDSVAWREERCCEVPHGFGPDVCVYAVDLAGVGKLAPGTAGREVLERVRRMRDPLEAAYFTASHLALRALLAEALGRSPDGLEFIKDQFGKPRLAGDLMRFNMSRSGSVALIGISHGTEIGVDVEKLAPVPDREALARQNFSVLEYERWRALESVSPDASFLRCWTRKEACVKAVGVGLALPLGQVDVGGAGNADRMQLQLAMDQRRWDVDVMTLPVWSGWVAAAALSWLAPNP